MTQTGGPAPPPVVPSPSNSQQRPPNYSDNSLSSTAVPPPYHDEQPPPKYLTMPMSNSDLGHDPNQLTHHHHQQFTSPFNKNNYIPVSTAMFAFQSLKAVGNDDDYHSDNEDSCDGEGYRINLNGNDPSPPTTNATVQDPRLEETGETSITSITLMEDEEEESDHKPPHCCRDGRMWVGVSSIPIIILTWFLTFTLLFPPSPLSHPNHPGFGSTPGSWLLALGLGAFGCINTSITITFFLSPLFPVLHREYHDMKGINAGAYSVRFRWQIIIIMMTMCGVVVASNGLLCLLSYFQYRNYLSTRITELKWDRDFYDELVLKRRLDRTHVTLAKEGPFQSAVFPPILSLLVSFFAIIPLITTTIPLIQWSRALCRMNKMRKVEREGEEEN